MIGRTIGKLRDWEENNEERGMKWTHSRKETREVTTTNTTSIVASLALAIKLNIKIITIDEENLMESNQRKWICSETIRDGDTESEWKSEERKKAVKDAGLCFS